MIDLHSHILPGLDDGVESIAAAIELALAAVEDGVTVMAATPHVRDDYPTSAEQMERELARLRDVLATEKVSLEVVRGGEIALDHLPRLDEGELRRFALGDSRALLLEFPYYGWPINLEQAVFELRLQGLRPVLAHPERNAEVQADPNRLEQVVNAGALVQLTAASVDGRIGRAPQSAARRLLELELAHLIASDAHAPSLREVGMGKAAATVGDDPLAHWLTQDVPAAILADEPLATRPERSVRRFGLRRRAGGD